MRFGFTQLDRRVPLSIGEYSAPPIVFPYEVINENLIPLLSRYSAAHSVSLGGSDYLLEVDEGYHYQYIAKTDDDDGMYFNGFFALAGAVIEATPFTLKAATTTADATSWGGVLPATIATVDGVPMGVGDQFLVHNIPASNGIYRILDGLGAYTQDFSFSTGLSVKIVEGVSNATKYYYFNPTDISPRQWQEASSGKVFFRVAGTPGMLVTAVFRRVIV